MDKNTEQDTGEGCRALSPTLCVHLSPSTSAKLETPHTPYPGDLHGGLVTRQDWSNQWPLVVNSTPIPLPSPEVWCGADVLTLGHMVSPGDQSPS